MKYKSCVTFTRGSKVRNGWWVILIMSPLKTHLKTFTNMSPVQPGGTRPWIFAMGQSRMLTNHSHFHHLDPRITTVCICTLHINCFNEGENTNKGCKGLDWWSCFLPAGMLQLHRLGHVRGVDVTCSYVAFCRDMTIPCKRVKMYPNNKPWVTKSVKSSIQKKRLSFKQGEAHDLRIATKELKLDILRAKQHSKSELEGKMAANNLGSAWLRIKTIAGRPLWMASTLFLPMLLTVLIIVLIPLILAGRLKNWVTTESQTGG